MSDEERTRGRRMDDERMADMRDTLHRVEDRLTHVEQRLENTEQQQRLMEVEQKGIHKLMNRAIDDLTAKVGDVFTMIDAHIRREQSDRDEMIKWLRRILTSVIIAIIGVVLTHVSRDGGLQL